MTFPLPVFLTSDQLHRVPKVYVDAEESVTEVEILDADGATHLLRCLTREAPEVADLLRSIADHLDNPNIEGN